MQKLKYLKYFSLFLKCIASYSDDVCTNITEGTKGTIKSIDREYVTCPAWYQVWKGFEKTFYEKVNDLNFNIDENYSSRVQGCNNLLEMKEMSIMKKDQNCVYELSKIISILTRNNKKDKFK